MPNGKKSDIGRNTRHARRMKEKRHKQRQMMGNSAVYRNFGIHFLASNSDLTDPQPVELVKTESLITQYLSTTPPPEIKTEKGELLRDQNKYDFPNYNMEVIPETPSIQEIQDGPPIAYIHIKQEFDGTTKRDLNLWNAKHQLPQRQ